MNDQKPIGVVGEQNEETKTPQMRPYLYRQQLSREAFKRPFYEHNIFNKKQRDISQVVPNK